MAATKRKIKDLDHNISSDDEDATSPDTSDTDSLDDRETVDEKRIRLAKELLQRVEAQEAADADSDEDTSAAIAARLQKEVEARSFYPKFSEDGWGATPARPMRGHQLPLTCVALTEDSTTAYTGSKDCTVVKCTAATCMCI